MAETLLVGFPRTLGGGEGLPRHSLLASRFHGVPLNRRHAAERLRSSQPQGLHSSEAPLQAPPSELRPEEVKWMPTESC